MIKSIQKKDSSESQSESLRLNHLEGVFFVLIYGVIFAFIYGITDTIRIVRKRAKKNKAS